MIVLYIFGIIVAFLVLLLMTNVKVHVKSDGDFNVKVGAGPVMLKVFPPRLICSDAEEAVSVWSAQSGRESDRDSICLASISMPFIESMDRSERENSAEKSLTGFPSR